MKQLSELLARDSLDEIQLPPVSKMDLIKYAGASGDFNPIHLIEEEAIKSGLPGIIAHGMWTMGQLSSLFNPYLQIGFIKKYTVRFKGMIFLKDVISLNAHKEKKEGDIVYFKTIAKNQKDNIVMQGTVEFLLI